MNNKIKLKISFDAYNKLMEIIEQENEIDCIRLELSEKCCKGPKVNIFLENTENMTNIDSKEVIDDLIVIIHSNMHEKVKEIVIIYNATSGFSIKTVPNDNHTKGTDSNILIQHKGCSGCKGCSR